MILIAIDQAACQEQAGAANREVMAIPQVVEDTEEEVAEDTEVEEEEVTVAVEAVMEEEAVEEIN